MKWSLSLLFIALQAFSVYGKSDTVGFDQLEVNLIKLRQQVIDAENDAVRTEANQTFRIALQEALKRDGSFEWALDSLPLTASLRSSDKVFRMINWNVPSDNQSHQYFCFIQYYNKKSKQVELFELTDKMKEIPDLQRSVVRASDWYGALYYDIIPVKRKGRTYYALLGWDGHNGLTTRKIIDVMRFSYNRPPRLGMGVFVMEKGRPKRIVFEYSSDVVMSMRYDKRKKQIIFDHLSPRQPELEGQYQFYSPDASYDAFVLKRGKWELQEDIDARGKGSDDNFVYPPGMTAP